MFAKEITYTGYDDVERTETFYFNLNRAELTELMLTDSDTTLDQVFEYFQATRNGKQMFNMLKDLITKSYGIKSMDGKSFLKDEARTQAFVQSEAFSEMIMDFFKNPDSIAEFFLGIVPKNLQKDLNDLYKQFPGKSPEEIQGILEARRKELNAAPSGTAQNS